MMFSRPRKFNIDEDTDFNRNRKLEAYATASQSGVSILLVISATI